MLLIFSHFGGASKSEILTSFRILNKLKKRIITET